MFEQLNLFSPPRSEPDTIRKPRPLEDTWWRPLTDYRYNENGRDSGWVRITREYLGRVFYNDERARLDVHWYSISRSGRPRECGRHWITEADLRKYFEQVPEPDPEPGQWVWHDC